MGLSHKQLKYVQLLANPENYNRSAQSFADELKVNIKTIYRWRENPKVQSEIEKTVKKHAMHSLPYAWKCLTERMPKDTQALKLYFTMIGEYKDSMELTGKDGGPVRLSYLAKQSDEDLEKLLKELE